MLPLWLGLLGPPVIWAVRFGVSYALVPSACSGAGLLWLQAVTLLALTGTAWAGVLAWRGWQGDADTDRVETEGVRVTNRRLGAAGVLGSLLFFLVIAAEGLAVFLIPACQGGGVPL